MTIRTALSRVGQIVAWTLLGVVVLYVLFAGPRPSGDGRIVLEYMYPGNPWEAEVYRALIEAFEEAHPHIRIKEIHPSSGVSLLQKLQIQIGGRVPPDVCWLDIGTIHQMAKFGGLLPLDDFIAADGLDMDDFQPAKFLETATYDGKLYGMPNGLNCCITFFNIDRFRDAGLPTPYELAQRGEWTWDTFIEVGQALSDPDNRVYSHDRVLHHPWTLGPIMETFGQELVDLENNKAYLDSPVGIQVLSMLRDFIYKYRIRPRTGEVTAIGGDMFISGQVAMNFMGRWVAPQYAEQITRFEWGVAPLPAGPLGTRTPLVGDYYCIPKHCRHPEEAWQLVKFLTGVQGQTIAASKGLLIPSRRSVAMSDAYLKYPGLPEKYNRVFIDEIYNNGTLLPVDEHFNRWSSNTVLPGLDNAFANRESIEDAVRRLNPIVEAILAEGD